MNDPPAFGFAPEQHRHSVSPRRFLRLARDLEAQVLDLHEVAKISAGVGRDPLDGISALRKLSADPIQPAADLFPPPFDRAAEST